MLLSLVINNFLVESWMEYLQAGFFIIIQAGREDKGKDTHALQVVGCSKKVDSYGKEKVLSWGVRKTLSSVMKAPFAVSLKAALLCCTLTLYLSIMYLWKDSALWKCAHSKLFIRFASFEITGNFSMWNLFWT